MSKLDVEERPAGVEKCMESPTCCTDCLSQFMMQADSPNLPERPEDSLTHLWPKGTPEYICYILGPLEPDLKRLHAELFFEPLGKPPLLSDIRRQHNSSGHTGQAQRLLAVIPVGPNVVSPEDELQRLRIVVQSYPEWDWLPETPKLRFIAHICRRRHTGDRNP